MIGLQGEYEHGLDNLDNGKFRRIIVKRFGIFFPIEV
jgi:hypothetical protein